MNTSRKSLINASGSLLLVMTILLSGCWSRSMGDSVLDIFINVQDRDNCYAESLLATFSVEQKLAMKSASLRSDGDRHEVNAMLLRGDQLVVSALGNPLVVPPGVSAERLVIVQFVAPPNAASADRKMARDLAGKFETWIARHEPSCWRIAHVRQNIPN